MDFAKVYSFAKNCLKYVQTSNSKQCVTCDFYSMCFNKSQSFANIQQTLICRKKQINILRLSQTMNNQIYLRTVSLKASATNVSSAYSTVRTWK